MAGRAYYQKGFLFTLTALLILAPFVAAQDNPLLKLQQSRASLNIDSNAQHGRGMYGITYGNPGDVWTYPNSASCLVVYDNGRFVLEKRDEQTVGRPKVKSAAGTLSPDELQQLKSILDDEQIKKLTTPKVPDLPSDARTVREIQTFDLEIDRGGDEQHFGTVIERVMTGGGNSVTASASTGLDTFLDNGAPYKKTLNPLMKWLKGSRKRTNPHFKIQNRNTAHRSISDN